MVCRQNPFDYSRLNSRAVLERYILPQCGRAIAGARYRHTAYDQRLTHIDDMAIVDHIGIQVDVQPAFHRPQVGKIGADGVRSQPRREKSAERILLHQA